jgi:hypothetical protein
MSPRLKKFHAYLEEMGSSLKPGPFIHHFPPRKHVLLKMLSKITQALEKINLYSP